ncbi:MAG: HMA2 domain-containing protein [bacterium]
MNPGNVRIIHAIPGRVRIRILKIKNNPALAAEIREKFSVIDGMKQVEANPVTGSILIHYDPGIIHSLHSLGSLWEVFSEFFPELTLPECQTLFISRSEAFGQAVSSQDRIAGIFGKFDTTVKEASGLSLKTIFPLALFILGVRQLLVSQDTPLPNWYDFLWFSFSAFFLLNKPTK